MVEYNIVKFCRLCKARFVVPKAKSMQFCCNACEAKDKKKSKK